MSAIRRGAAVAQRYLVSLYFLGVVPSRAVYARWVELPLRLPLMRAPLGCRRSSSPQ